MANKEEFVKTVGTGLRRHKCSSCARISKCLVTVEKWITVNKKTNQPVKTFYYWYYKCRLCGNQDKYKRNYGS